jgi:hypothetical protein
MGIFKLMTLAFSLVLASPTALPSIKMPSLSPQLSPKLCDRSL